MLIEYLYNVNRITTVRVHTNIRLDELVATSKICFVFRILCLTMQNTN